MFCNAAGVTRLVVLVVFAARGDAALENLRKPTSAVVAPPVAQPAAPVVAAAAPVAQPVAPVVAAAAAPVAQPAAQVVAAAAAPVVQAAPMAKASTDHEQEIVKKALTATAKTYEALRTQSTGKEGLGASPRVEQAKQVVAQIHAANQKVTQVAPAPVKPALQVEPEWPNMPRLDAEIREAEDQAENKKKELKLQAGLETEKEVEAGKAQKHAGQLRERANKLRKEAELATQIANEKSEEAAKAEKGEKSTENKATNLVAEEREMQRMLKQTQKEELDLERNISSMKLAKTKAQPVVKVQVQGKTSPTDLKPHSVAPALKSTQAMNQEAIQKMQNLVDENNLLKHEKAELERQLNIRKVAKEKAKLKQKLKNRLALADRHMKMRKRALPPPH